MGLDATLQKAASAGYKALGRTATLRRVTTGTYDPATGTTTDTTTDYSLTGRRVEFNATQVDGTAVQASDFRFEFSASDTAGIVPRTADKLILAGTTYPIVRVTPTDGKDGAVLYSLQCRA